ncbi:hypothetical protein HAX54_010864, partial [Datura stramonium]|nr:hypothetical protein [Datura stramonium]
EELRILEALTMGRPTTNRLVVRVMVSDSMENFREVMEIWAVTNGKLFPFMGW